VDCVVEGKDKLEAESKKIGYYQLPEIIFNYEMREIRESV
jgi:hypothetical protein